MLGPISCISYSSVVETICSYNSVLAHPSEGKERGMFRPLLKTLTALPSLTRGRSFKSLEEVVPVFKQAFQNSDLCAVQDSEGTYSYGGLLKSAVELSREITEKLQGRRQERVTLLVSNDANMVIAFWAVWMSGQIGVPLVTTHPNVAHDYFIADSDSNLLISCLDQIEQAGKIAASNAIPLLIIDAKYRENASIKVKVDPKTMDASLVVDPNDFSGLQYKDLGLDDAFYANSNALIIYSSGATGSPKGAVFSHSNINAQTSCVTEAWRMSKRDCFLLALPSKSNPSVMSSFIAPLSIGARVILLSTSSPEDIWIELLGIRKAPETRPNIMLTRPPVIEKLIQTYDKKLTKNERMTDYIRNVCSTRIRFISCGSGPISKKTYDKWEQCTGHQVIERYSTSETGMVMATPLHGSKHHGTVGLPMPGYRVRLTSPDGGALVAEGNRSATKVFGVSQPATGMLQVRGDGVFTGYWRKPHKSNESLTRDGWFKTGDLAQYSRGAYSVLGRATTDTYNIGSSKVSLLEVEAMLRDHPEVIEVAAVGLRDTMAAAVTRARNSKLTESALLQWTEENIPKKLRPDKIVLTESIPKTWTGKPNKAEVISQFFTSSSMKEEAKKD